MAGDAGVTLPWSQLHDEARATAAALQARGVSPGDHVAILGPTTRELVTLIQGTWLAGATIMVLPLPMRLASIEAFVAQTRVRIRKGDAVLVAIDDQLAEFVAPEPGDPPMVGIADLVAEGARLGADRLTPSTWRRRTWPSCSSPAARRPSPRA
ncbi:MAG: AMP-binding protein [Acidimicrobiales bacterium]